MNLQIGQTVQSNKAQNEAHNVALLGFHRAEKLGGSSKWRRRDIIVGQDSAGTSLPFWNKPGIRVGNGLETRDRMETEWKGLRERKGILCERSGTAVSMVWKKGPRMSGGGAGRCDSEVSGRCWNLDRHRHWGRIGKRIEDGGWIRMTPWQPATRSKGSLSSGRA
jgi:hypothetical protein